MRFLKVVSFLLAGVCVTFAAVEENQDLSTMNVIGGVVEKCIVGDEFENCLAEEAAGTIGKAFNIKSIQLAPGLSLTKTDDEIIEEDESQARSSMTPYEKIWDNFNKLISTRSLNLQLSDFEEGRKKKKKMAGYIGVAIATAAAILIPIKLKFIGWMAGTALMIGKVALVLASLVGLKKLVSKPHEETTHVHYDSHRSDEGHYLAYNAHNPELNK